jgi:hypothetical protein
MFWGKDYNWFLKQKKKNEAAKNKAPKKEVQKAK